MILEDATDRDIEMIEAAGLISQFEPRHEVAHRLVSVRKEDDFPTFQGRQPVDGEADGTGYGHPEIVRIQFMMAERSDSIIATDFTDLH